MRIGNVQVLGDAIKPRPPQNGVLYNILLGDRFRGLYPSALAPFGHLSLSAETDSYVLATGVSPAMIVPVKEDSLLNEYKHMGFEELYQELKTLVEWRDVSSVNRDWQSIDPKAVQDGFAHTSNDRWSTTITKHHTIQYFLSTLQKRLSFVKPTSQLRVEAIGLGTIDEEGDVVRRPHEATAFGNYRMRFNVAAQPLKYREYRTIYLYHAFFSYCVQRFLETLPKSKWLSQPYDVHALASYMLYAYGGSGKPAPDSVLLNADDIIDQVLEYTVLPYSEAYPHLFPEEDSSKDRVFAEWMMKVVFGMAVNRVGGLTVPVNYSWVAGAAAVVRDALPHYIKPTLEMGGSNNIWMHPAYIRDTIDGLYVPMPIRPYEAKGKRSEWARRTKMAETFKPITVDRGEVSQPENEARDNLRLHITRDGRVYTVRTQLERYLAFSVPVGHGSKLPAKQQAPAYMLSFISDPEADPSSACFVTPRSFGAKMVSTVSTGPRAGETPLPSGVVANQSGTDEYVASGEKVDDDVEVKDVIDESGSKKEDPQKDNA